MKKRKICVYAICKNEEKFALRWINSMKEADKIFVLDTGSTDNSVNILKENGAIVKNLEINPWRFDVARNKSLEMVPLDADICVCTDLDEVFEKGWREKLESIWSDNTNRCRYIYNWSFEKDKPSVSFYYEKIHSRNGYKWVNPVHEVLTTDKNENIVTSDEIVLNHYPDPTKSRASYLELLELSVKEDSENDRNMHYLGREYMFRGKYKEAIETLKKHLNLKSATWKDERCASMRFIARCYKFLEDYDNAKKYLDMAILESPYLRDPYVEKALLLYDLEDYEGVEKYCLKALQITNHEKTYINETFSWDNTIYDLLSISCYNLEKYDYALYFVDIALSYDNTNERLINNREIFKRLVNNN